LSVVSQFIQEAPLMPTFRRFGLSAKSVQMSKTKNGGLDQYGKVCKALTRSAVKGLTSLAS